MLRLSQGRYHLESAKRNGNPHQKDDDHIAPCQPNHPVSPSCKRKLEAPLHRDQIKVFCGLRVMVYLGPSKGCLTCRRRRKKCDETRPSCMRCVAAKRTCGGYEDRDKEFKIRHFNDQERGAESQSSARKCTLPARDAVPGTEVWTKDDLPKEVSEKDIDEFAVRCFFYEFCITPANHAVSHGFLSCLEQRVRRTSGRSALTKACELVAFASHAIKLNRPRLLSKAEDLNNELVSLLAADIQNAASTKRKEEAILVAALLGIYEMIIARDSHSGFHIVHASGVYALLQIGNSPFRLLEEVRNGGSLGNVRNSLLRCECGMIDPSSPARFIQPLDSLISALHRIYVRRENTLETSLMTGNYQTLLQEATELEKAFVGWEEAQGDELRPNTIGTVSRSTLNDECSPGCFPGKVDTYFDIYVASIWNVYRAARLYLMELIASLQSAQSSPEFMDSSSINYYHLVEGILSSIPYHLTEDLHEFVQDVNTERVIQNPGKIAHGLLLMHPIHVVSSLPTVDPEVKQYMKRCLMWIGDHMGIGQASLMAKSPTTESQDFMSSSMLILIGLLV